jgi:predicted RNA-binding Zn-ribbon protein involved in translation (DUF1610 family)
MNDNPMVPLVNDSSLDGLMKSVDEYLKSPDHQEPTFVCPACGDTGFLVREDSRGRRFGRKCECLIRAMSAKSRDVIEFKGRRADKGIEDDEGLPF